MRRAAMCGSKCEPGAGVYREGSGQEAGMDAFHVITPFFPAGGAIDATHPATNTLFVDNPVPARAHRCGALRFITSELYSPFHLEQDENEGPPGFGEGGEAGAKLG